MFDPVFTLLCLAAIALPICALIFWLNGQNRETRRTKGIVLFACAAASVVGFVCYAGPVLFVSNDGILNVYVIVPAPMADTFNDRLGGILAKHGFSQNAGKSPFGGLNYYVMNGSGHSLWLWSTNVPMSPQEDVATCGRYPEAHPDPGQFSLSVSRIWPFGTKAAQHEYMARIVRDLKNAGYEVRTQGMQCSPASKILAPG